MRHFDNFYEFYCAFERKKPRMRITYDDLEVLLLRLRNEGYKINRLRDWSYIVRSPEDIKAAVAKRRAMQAVGASRFTKLGAAFPKETVSLFAEACRILGCTQSSILIPVIENTIKQAEFKNQNAVDDT
jgi:hypothetical protein